MVERDALWKCGNRAVRALSTVDRRRSAISAAPVFGRGPRRAIAQVLPAFPPGVVRARSPVKHGWAGRGRVPDMGSGRGRRGGLRGLSVKRGDLGPPYPLTAIPQFQVAVFVVGRQDRAAQSGTNGSSG